MAARTGTSTYLFLVVAIICLEVPDTSRNDHVATALYTVATATPPNNYSKMDAGDQDRYASEEFDSEQSELLEGRQEKKSSEERLSSSEQRRESCDGPSDRGGRQSEDTNEDGSRETDRNSEKVLVEKDGKFELVNESEVNAHFDRSHNDMEPQLQEEKHEHTENDVMRKNTSEEVVKGSALSDSNDCTDLEEAGDHETVKTEGTEEKDPCEEDNRPVLNEEDRDDVIRTGQDENDVPVSGRSREIRRVSAETVMPTSLETAQAQAVRSQSAYSRTSRRSTIGNLAETIPKSRQSSNRAGQQPQADESANRKQAQEAFRVWLAAKAEQKQKEKALKAKREQEKKQSMGWAVRSPVTRKDCDARFEEWLDEKKHQKHREQQLQSKQKQLMEEETVQPSQEEIERAYKQ